MPVREPGILTIDVYQSWQPVFTDDETS